MRLLPTLLTIALVGCGATPKDQGGQGAAPRGGSRGIVLVTIDGWWDPQTKTDTIPPGLVPNGVRLTNAITPSPQLRPAIVSILTGKSPMETGVRNDLTSSLPESVALVPEGLKERGWRTGAFVADPRAGIGSGLERGFEVFDPPKEILFGSSRRLPHPRNPADVVSDFSTWLASVPEDASFFAWIQISRPVVGTGGAAPIDPKAALEHLASLLQGTSRLKNAAVAVAGTAGQIAPDDGESSGYFVNAVVIRVPVILRSGAGSRQAPDPGAPFMLTDLAGWIAAEGGLDHVSGDATPAGTPRIARSFRGHDEFGWPIELAAQQGTALCVQNDRCSPWDPATEVTDADRRSCLAALEVQGKASEDQPSVPRLPADLALRLKQLRLEPPPVTAASGKPVSREVRARVVPAIMRARRIEDRRKALEADAAYQKALAGDPGNFGVLIEAAEALALDNHAKLARARLDKAFRSTSWNAGAWHWLGHVSYLEKKLDAADAQWQVSDELNAGNGDVLYDLACARSLMGRIPDADAYLRRAWTAGFREVNQIQVDPDLRNLRADPAFLRFMREVVH